MKKKVTQRPAFVLILLVILFLGSLGLAFLAYHQKTMVFKSANIGQILTTPEHPFVFTQLNLRTPQGQAVSAKSLNGKWLVVYLNPAACTQVCLQRLHDLNQVWKATGRDMRRVQRVFLTFTNTATPQLSKLLSQKGDYAGTKRLQVKPQQFEQFMQGAPDLQQVMQSGAFYIVDPLGNIVLQYPADVKPAGILRDLQRLLRVSQVG